MFSRRDKMKKKDEMSAESAKLFVSAQSVKASDIPQPDSSSGKSFDELYRLKEVVSFEYTHIKCLVACHKVTISTNTHVALACC